MGAGSHLFSAKEREEQEIDGYPGIINGHPG
jgi:hypothetical protein